MVESKWVSLVVVMPKKNGNWLFFMDYKPLIAKAKRNRFLLSFEDEILNKVVGYECYTMYDGYLGYFQIKIAKEDQLKPPPLHYCGVLHTR